MLRTGRNELCSCGSGKKFKRCCHPRNRERFLPMNEEKKIEAATQFPTIEVAWNAAEQSVGVRFDSKEFRNWEFVLAVLEMAKQQVEVTMRQQHAVFMMQAQAQARQEAAIKKQLNIH